MNLCVWRILTLSSYSHFAQGHRPYLFSTHIPCAILELSGTIPELTDRVRIPTLRRTIPELYRFLLCAEHIYPRDKVWMSTETSCHFIHLLQVLKKNLFQVRFYTKKKNDLIHVYRPRAESEVPRGQSFDVNRNILSLRSFFTSFKKISLKSDFIHFFFKISYMYRSRGRQPPRGQNFDVNKKALSLYQFVASFKKSLWSLMLYTFFMI